MDGGDLVALLTVGEPGKFLVPLLLETCVTLGCPQLHGGGARTPLVLQPSPRHTTATGPRQHSVRAARSRPKLRGPLTPHASCAFVRGGSAASRPFGWRCATTAGARRHPAARGFAHCRHLSPAATSPLRRLRPGLSRRSPLPPPPPTPHACGSGLTPSTGPAYDRAPGTRTRCGDRARGSDDTGNAVQRLTSANMVAFLTQRESFSANLFSSLTNTVGP